MNKPALTLIYFIAFFQGLAWAIIPTLGNELLSAITPTQYGLLGLLLIIGAVIASFTSGTISQYVGAYKVFLGGIVLNVLTQIAFSTAYSYAHIIYLLALGMFLLGCAIGTTITTINVLLLHLTKHKSAAITALYGVVGLGATLAPYYVMHFEPKWWGATTVLTVVFAILFVSVAMSHKLKTLEIEPEQELSLGKMTSLWSSFPTKFIFFGLIGILFGIFESTYSIWGPVFLHQTKHLTTEQASYGITTFWGASTIGHFIFAYLFYTLPSRFFYPAFPIAMTLALFFTNFADTATQSLILFALAGLSTAAFFPLTIRFASRKFPHLEGPIFGTLYAFYFLGIGITSYMLGLLQVSLKVSLGYLFHFLPIVPLALLFLSFYVSSVSKPKCTKGHH